VIRLVHGGAFTLQPRAGAQVLAGSLKRPGDAIQRLFNGLHRLRHRVQVREKILQVRHCVFAERVIECTLQEAGILCKLGGELQHRLVAVHEGIKLSRHVIDHADGQRMNRIH